MDRAACIELIERVLGSAPRKSSCTFCPLMQEAEWQQLADESPELFDYSLVQEANAWVDVKKPHEAGLFMRGLVKRSKGKVVSELGVRSLINWAVRNGIELHEDIVTVQRERNLEYVAASKQDWAAADKHRVAAAEAVGRVAFRAFPERYATVADATPVAPPNDYKAQQEKAAKDAAAA